MQFNIFSKKTFIISKAQRFHGKQVKILIKIIVFFVISSYINKVRKSHQMIGLVRKIVAGPKNRTKWKDVELDLTYITDRIIAMAYPASGLEKAYRNSIDDVSEYFKTVHHGNFLVINVSMRKYDYQKFDGKVKDYFWPDHQAPPLTTIIIICRDMHQFFAKSIDGAVTVHCNHGKGRTGTCIISFMLYAREFSSAEEALTFYNKKRFIVDTYGVDQPCQRRYLDYTQKILKMQNIPKKLKAFKLVRIQTKNLHIQDYYLQISVTRTCQTKHTKLGIHKVIKNNMIPLVNDIFIELYEYSWKGEKQVARINYNLFFIEYCQKQQAYKVLFKGSDIKVNGKHSRQFELQLLFVQFCQCHIEKPKGFCECEADRIRQQQEWEKMIQILEERKKIPQGQMDQMVYGKACNKYEDIQENGQQMVKKQWKQKEAVIEN